MPSSNDTIRQLQIMVKDITRKNIALKETIASYTTSPPDSTQLMELLMSMTDVNTTLADHILVSLSVISLSGSTQSLAAASASGDERDVVLPSRPRAVGASVETSPGPSRRRRKPTKNADSDEESYQVGPSTTYSSGGTTPYSNDVLTAVTSDAATLGIPQTAKPRSRRRVLYGSDGDDSATPTTSQAASRHQSLSPAARRRKRSAPVLESPPLRGTGGLASSNIEISLDDVTDDAFAQNFDEMNIGEQPSATDSGDDGFDMDFMSKVEAMHGLTVSKATKATMLHFAGRASSASTTRLIKNIVNWTDVDKRAKSVAKELEKLLVQDSDANKGAIGRVLMTRDQNASSFVGYLASM